MESSSILDKAVKEDGNEPCTSTQQAQQERYAQCRRRARDQRLFTWNRAHWIGMVVLIAVLLLLQWSSSMYLMPDEVLDRAAKNLFVCFPGMVLHWPLVLGITNLILGSTRSGSLSFPLASAIIGPLAFGWTNLRVTAGVPYRSWLKGKPTNIMKTAISCNDARADPSKGPTMSEQLMEQYRLRGQRKCRNACIAAIVTVVLVLAVAGGVWWTAGDGSALVRNMFKPKARLPRSR